jgi:hypothetical protein
MGRRELLAQLARERTGLIDKLHRIEREYEAFLRERGAVLDRYEAGVRQALEGLSREAARGLKGTELDEAVERAGKDLSRLERSFQEFTRGEPGAVHDATREEAGLRRDRQLLAHDLAEVQLRLSGALRAMTEGRGPGELPGKEIAAQRKYADDERRGFREGERPEDYIIPESTGGSLGGKSLAELTTDEVLYLAAGASYVGNEEREHTLPGGRVVRYSVKGIISHGVLNDTAKRLAREYRDSPAFVRRVQDQTRAEVQAGHREYEQPYTQDTRLGSEVAEEYSRRTRGEVEVQQRKQVDRSRSSLQSYRERLAQSQEAYVSRRARGEMRQSGQVSATPRREVPLSPATLARALLPQVPAGGAGGEFHAPPQKTIAQVLRERELDRVRQGMSPEDSAQVRRDEELDVGSWGAEQFKETLPSTDRTKRERRGEERQERADFSRSFQQRLMSADLSTNELRYLLARDITPRERRRQEAKRDWEDSGRRVLPEGFTEYELVHGTEAAIFEEARSGRKVVGTLNLKEDLTPYQQRYTAKVAGSWKAEQASGGRRSEQWRRAASSVFDMLDPEGAGRGADVRGPAREMERIYRKIEGLAGGNWREQAEEIRGEIFKTFYTQARGEGEEGESDALTREERLAQVEWYFEDVKWEMQQRYREMLKEAGDDPAAQQKAARWLAGRMWEVPWEDEDYEPYLRTTTVLDPATRQPVTYYGRHESWIIEEHLMGELTARQTLLGASGGELSPREERLQRHMEDRLRQRDYTNVEKAQYIGELEEVGGISGLEEEHARNVEVTREELRVRDEIEASRDDGTYVGEGRRFSRPRPDEGPK